MSKKTGRPAMAPELKKKPVSLMMDQKVKQACTFEAKNENLSFSGFVSKCISEYFQRNKPYNV